MVHDPGQQAIDDLRRLLAAIRSQPGAAAQAPVVEAAEHLERALAACHMEAIRFRMFTLGRMLAQPGPAGSPQVRELFEALRASLEAAGFQTRSVAH